MNKNEIDPREYLKILLKRKWVIISITLVIVLAVIAKTMMIIPLFKATTTILIERKSADLLKNRKSGFRSNELFYKTQFALLKSSNLGKRVVKRLNLREREEFEMNKNISEDEKDFLVGKRLIDGLKVLPQKFTYLVSVSFTDKDKTIVADVANGFVEEYILQQKDHMYGASKEATSFLEEKIVVLRGKLEKSEQALQKYKQENRIIAFAGKEDGYSMTLKALMNDVHTAENQRIGIEVQYKQMKHLVYKPELIDTIPLSGTNTFITSLKSSEANLQKELSSLSKRFGYKHPKIIQVKEELKSIQSRLHREIRKLTNVLKNEYEIALKKEERLKKTLAEQQDGSHELNKKMITFGVLQRDVNINRHMFDVLLTRFKETAISSGLQNISVFVVEKARTPGRPFNQKKATIIFLGVLAGLFIGVVIALFIEYLDTSIKSGDDIKNTLGITFLGPVPRVGGEGKKSSVEHREILTAEKDRKSHASEAYRGLRTAIKYSSSAEEQKTIVFTSAVPGEGKTSTIANIATVMAQAGEKVLLIDTDLRKPRLHHVFNLSKEIGITNFLVEGTPLKDIVQKTEIPNLSIITCGHIPPNPSELLGDKKLRLFLDTIQEKGLFDRILLDSPPVLAVTDPLILSRIANSVVLVTNQEKSNKESVRRAIEKLKGVNAHILGAVLNQIATRGKNAAGYYYYNDEYSYYYYGNDDDEEGAQKEKKKKV